MSREEEVGRDQETAVLENYERRLGRFALFDDLMAEVDEGNLTFEEAVERFKNGGEDVQR